MYEAKAPYREKYNQPLALQTGASSIKIGTTWSESGRVYIQQPDPLPLITTVTNVEAASPLATQNIAKLTAEGGDSLHLSNSSSRSSSPEILSSSENSMRVLPTEVARKLIFSELHASTPPPAPEPQPVVVVRIDKGKLIDGLRRWQKAHPAVDVEMWRTLCEALQAAEIKEQ